MQYENENTAHSRYSACQLDRNLFLDRARESSELTIPTLIPPDGNNNTTDYPTPYNSIGARAVNNLASKLLIALIPPNAPFFLLKIDDFVLKEMEGDENLRTELEKGLSQVEKAVMTNIETGADRVAIFEALKHLIVAGNVLLYVSENGLRVFSLDRFTCKRDPMGNVKEIVTKESLSYNTLPEDLKLMVKLRDIDDLSYDEMSRIAKLPIGTIKSKLHRARDILIKVLGKYADDE